MAVKLNAKQTMTNSIESIYNCVKWQKKLEGSRRMWERDTWPSEGLSKSEQEEVKCGGTFQEAADSRLHRGTENSPGGLERREHNIWWGREVAKARLYRAS